MDAVVRSASGVSLWVWPGVEGDDDATERDRCLTIDGGLDGDRNEDEGTGELLVDAGREPCSGRIGLNLTGDCN